MYQNPGYHIAGPTSFGSDIQAICRTDDKKISAEMHLMRHMVGYIFFTHKPMTK
jgi:hypothetical protein